jgi:hypothetical protein
MSKLGRYLGWTGTVVGTAYIISLAVNYNTHMEKAETFERYMNTELGNAHILEEHSPRQKGGVEHFKKKASAYEKAMKQEKKLATNLNPFD